MFHFFKMSIRQASTKKKNITNKYIKYEKNKTKKHKFDIENESWTKPRVIKPFSYSYVTYFMNNAGRKKQ